ncbi:unsaturated rhamnogalacturonyl hydrolase [bacterium A37T11]|nr:unsaturated rhamnogalacturonyl hydrolase [bacterium A37T11]
MKIAFGLLVFFACFNMSVIKGQEKHKMVFLDYYYNREYRKDIDGHLKRYHYIWEETDESGYSVLGNIFRDQGATIDSLTEKPSAVNLSKASVYIIVDPDTEKETPHPNNLEPSEIVVLTNWVKQGGVLVLLGNDAGNAEFAHFNQLANHFGIHFNEDNALMVKNNQFAQGAVYTKQDNAIFHHAYKIYLKEVSTLKVSPPAKVVLAQKGLNLMATARYGKGTVFALGDPWIYNEYLDGNKLPKDFENYPAATAWVSWLLKRSI